MVDADQIAIQQIINGKILSAAQTLRIGTIQYQKEIVIIQFSRKYPGEKTGTHPAVAARQIAGDQHLGIYPLRLQK